MSTRRVVLGRLEIPLNPRQQKHYDNRVQRVDDLLRKHFKEVSVSTRNLYNCTAFEVKFNGLLEEKLRNEIRLEAGAESLIAVDGDKGLISVKVFKPNTFQYGYKRQLFKDVLLLIFVILLLVLLQTTLSYFVSHKHAALLCHLLGRQEECHRDWL